MLEDKHISIHISSGTIIKTLFIGALCVVAFYLRDIILVLLTSIVVASSIEPITRFLVQRQIPRIVAVIMIYVVLALIMLSVIYFLLLPLLAESSDFLTNFSTYFNAKTVSNSIDHNKFLSGQPIVTGLRNSIDLDAVIGEINNLIDRVSSGAFNTVSTVFGSIVSFFLMIVISFYLSVEKDGVGTFLRIITPLKHERYVIDLWQRAQRKIGLWMQGQLVLAIIIGVLVYLGLLLLNVPNPLLLAFLAAAFEIIPLFGPILASIPAIALAFTEGGLSLAMVVVGLYLIIHQFENQLIYPLVVKKVIGVSPIVSIISLIAGWELLGFLGLILSVPVATVIMEFFDDVEKNKIEQIENSKAVG